MEHRSWEEETLAAFERSLKLLGLEYVDLYLVHWPRVRGRKRGRPWSVSLRRIGSSDRCQQLYHQAPGGDDRPPVRRSGGRSGGVLLPVPEGVAVLLPHRGRGPEAHSPLTRGSKLNDPRLMELAKKYERSPAQMMIRWVLQRMVVIPKSAPGAPHRERWSAGLQHLLGRCGHHGLVRRGLHTT